MHDLISFEGHPVHRWRVGSSTYLALPEKGARLMAWDYRRSDGTNRPVLHWPEGADFDRIEKIRGGNPILFPFVARSFDGGAIGYWRDPSGNRLPMPMHGFARDGHFEVSECRDRGFTARLQPGEIARAAYPYPFAFTVSYDFEPDGLKVGLSLRNPGPTAIPWCAGHHFYFRLPWHPGAARGDYRFEVSSERAFRQTPNGALAEISPPNAVYSLADEALIDRMHAHLAPDECRVVHPGSGERLHFRIKGGETASPWNTITTWTQAPDSPFYCIEPWMGPPNSAETGKGIQWVQPAEERVFTVEVSLDG